MKDFESAVRKILQEIGEDPDRQGLVDTPKRIEKMYRDLTRGYRQSADELINSALFDVGGVHNILSVGATETTNGIIMTLISVYNEDGSENDQATFSLYYDGEEPEPEEEDPEPEVEAKNVVLTPAE